MIALAMGVQNASISTFSGVAVNTSFLTGDYSQFGKALADLINVPGGHERVRERLAVLGPLLCAYAVGALCAAFLNAVAYDILLIIPIVLAIAYVARVRVLT